MTSKELYEILLEIYKVDEKQDKRKVYDFLETEHKIGTKQLGGMVSALSRKGLVKLDKVTITLLAEKDGE